jgi:hypothetical protein
MYAMAWTHVHTPRHACTATAVTEWVTSVTVWQQHRAAAPHLLGEGGQVLTDGAIFHAALQACSQRLDALQQCSRCVSSEVQGRQRL